MGVQREGLLIWFWDSVLIRLGFCRDIREFVSALKSYRGRLSLCSLVEVIWMISGCLFLGYGFASRSQG